MKPGIYTIPFEQYEGVEAASKHMLDALAISPLHAWTFFRNPERHKPKETPAKVVGSAIHTAILEPERFEKEYIKEPDKNEIQKTSTMKILDTLDDYKSECKSLGVPVSGTKAELQKRLASHHSFYYWDVFYANITYGKKVLSAHDWYVVKAITSRVRKHPAASGLFEVGQAEQSMFWIDPDTEVPCKGRLDWLTPDSIIVDLKSTTDASPEGFQRSISRYRYYVQAAMYVDGMKQLGHMPPAFVFAAWEKTAPYASALYYATNEMIEIGRQEYKRLLKIYRDCVKYDRWDGYSQEIMPINLPENFKAASPESELDWLDQMEG